MRKSPAWEFRTRLTPEESDFFLTQRLRTEINAMSSQQLIDFIEGKLEEHGLTEKVVPPANVTAYEFKKASEDHLQEAAEELVGKVIKEALGATPEELAVEAMESMLDGYDPPENFYDTMGAELNNGRREQSWRDYVGAVADERSKTWADERRHAVGAKLRERVGQERHEP